MKRVVLEVPAMVVVACAIAGCAETAKTPFTTEGLSYLGRATLRVDGGLSVSTAVLSSDESKSLYGAELAKKHIQPVWIEVRNDEPHSYFLMSPGLDPNFFPASEAAEAFDSDATQGQKNSLDQRFNALAFHNPVVPGQTASGFVLTNLSEGAKLVQLDFVASGQARTFSILTVVPGFQADYKTSKVFARAADASESVVDYTDDEAFRAALEALPCCVTNKDGSKDGDPVNLVIVGGLDDAFPALVRRGWSPTEQKWAGAIWRMVTSALSGERYVNAPVSDLYLFGRPQDLALQKARDTIHQRNHLRLWLTAMRYHGKAVWVGQISRDIGIRLTFHSPTLTTHKIDPDVDEARTALTEDMAYSQSLVKLGLVKGVGPAPQSAPRENLTTDPYYTDGNRQVLVFDHAPRSLADIELFPWVAEDALKATSVGGKQ